MITAETLNRIIQFRGDGLPVISLYVPVDPGASRRDARARVDGLIDGLDEEAGNHWVEQERRQSVRGDIDHIRQRLAGQTWPPRAVAIFACGERGLYEEVPLPRRVRERIVVDEAPFVRPMLAVLDESPRSCVVVTDKESARFWEHYADELEELKHVRDQVGRKPTHAAGLAADRVRNRTDDLVKRHYRRVAGIIDELFRGGGYDLLIVGGHEYEIPAFLEFLSRDVRERVAGTFHSDLGGRATVPLAEIRTAAAEIAGRYQRDAGQRLVAETLDTLAAGGHAAAGLESCLWAGSVAAIRTLLVPEGASVPGVVCDESGWLALAGDTCPLCGKPARAVPDVIEELVEAVIDESGAIHHVPPGTKLDEYTLAAALRFPLPPPAA